jgi:hypothetical protein
MQQLIQLKDEGRVQDDDDGEDIKKEVPKIRRKLSEGDESNMADSIGEHT